MGRKPKELLLDKPRGESHLEVFHRKFLTFDASSAIVACQIMKKNDKLRRRAEETITKIRAISRHIRNVEDNCVLLGTKLIERGEVDLGHKLIANGHIHDASKFWGIEWEHMAPGQPTQEEGAKMKLKLAVQHHQTTNLHHPEAWPGGISTMPDVYLCEMICDIKARSEEFGTDLRQWISETATQKYGFMKESFLFKKIMDYVDLLCPKPFEDLSK